MNSTRTAFAAAALSLLFFCVLIGVWYLATLPTAEVQGATDEYAKLMGKGAKKVNGFPTPCMLGDTVVKHLSDWALPGS